MCGLAEVAGLRAGRVSQSPGEAQGYSGGGRNLGARRCSLCFASGSPKGPAQVPAASGGSQAQGVCSREAPASRPGDRAAPRPGPGVPGALLSGNACGGHCPGPGEPASIQALRRLLHQRGCDHWGCDPLTRSAGSAEGPLPAASLPTVGHALYPRGHRGGAGGNRTALLIDASIRGPQTCRPPSKAPRRGEALCPGWWRLSQVNGGARLSHTG